MTRRPILIATAIAIVLYCGVLGVWAQQSQGTLTAQQSQRYDAIVLSQNFSTAGSQGTITITPPAGQFVYIVGIDAQPCNGTNTTATTGFVTTTGLSGTPKWGVHVTATAQQCGSGFAFYPMAPFKSSAAGANVTVVTPAALANATWNTNVYYYFST